MDEVNQVELLNNMSYSISFVGHDTDNQRGTF